MSGKGRNTARPAVPPKIYGAMTGVTFFSLLVLVVVQSFSSPHCFVLFFVDFFKAKWAGDYGVLITDCINEKGCQARSEIQRKAAKTAAAASSTAGSS